MMAKPSKKSRELSGPPQISERRFSLKSIRAAQKKTGRDEAAGSSKYKDTSRELETYFNNATFDLSLRLSAVERELKNGTIIDSHIPGLLDAIAMGRKNLQVCSEVGNYAIRKAFSKR